MIKPIDPDAVMAVTLASDKAEPKTIFHIKPMTFKKSMQIGGRVHVTRAGDVAIDNITLFKESAFADSVVKIENWQWPGADGPVVLEKRDEIIRAFAHLSVADGQEIERKIENISTLDEAERKN